MGFPPMLHRWVISDSTTTIHTLRPELAEMEKAWLGLAKMVEALKGLVDILLSRAKQR